MRSMVGPNYSIPLLYLLLSLCHFLTCQALASARRTSSSRDRPARRRRPQRSPARKRARDRRATTPTRRSDSTLVGEKRSDPFDPCRIVSAQESNESGAVPLELEASQLRLVTSMDESSHEALETSQTARVKQPAFRFLSLDAVFPEYCGFSDMFHNDVDFRTRLRSCIRQDTFAANPQYENVSEKAKQFLLEQPDSSVQGSWECPTPLTTALLQETFGASSRNPANGVGILQTIGQLCGPDASTHWIDIVGVQGRRVSHSWHQDTGRPNLSTVLWGFPKNDHKEGCGIYTHIVPLSHQHLAPPGHARNEPVLFQGTVDEKHIVRPAFGPGRELLVYSDVDVLHSAPDVTHRTSVMRFM